MWDTRTGCPMKNEAVGIGCIVPRCRPDEFLYFLVLLYKSFASGGVVSGLPVQHRTNKEKFAPSTQLLSVFGERSSPVISR